VDACSRAKPVWQALAEQAKNVEPAWEKNAAELADLATHRAARLSFPRFNIKATRSEATQSQTSDATPERNATPPIPSPMRCSDKLRKAQPRTSAAYTPFWAQSVM
jgi:hypothetical protein